MPPLSLLGQTTPAVPPAARQAAASSPQAAYHFSLARWLAGEGEVQGAIAEFDRAVALEPRDPYLRLEYAELLLRVRRLEEAAAEVGIAYQLAPDLPDVLQVYGQIHYARSALDESASKLALVALERLRAKAPHEVQSMLTLAQLYSAEGRVEEAIAVLREVAGYHPDSQQLRQILAGTLREAGRSQEAEEVLVELLRVLPGELDTRIEVADARSARGDHDGAIEVLERAPPEQIAQRRLELRLAEELLRRSAAAGRTGEQREADLAGAARLVNAWPSEVEPPELFLRARVRFQLGEYDAAAVDLERLREQAPQSLDVHRQLALLRERTGQGEQAARDLRAAADRLAASNNEAGARELRRSLLGLLLRRGEWRFAADLASQLRLQASEDERHDLLSIELDALREAGQGEQALQILDQEEKANGRSAGLVLLRVQLLIELERAARARAQLDDPLLRGRLTREQRLRYADLLLRLQSDSAAIGALNKLVDEGLPADALVAGQLLSGHQKYQLALTYLERAVAAGDEGTGELRRDANFWLGQALERSGRTQEAASAFERVLALDPNNAPTLNYLGYMWADQGVNLQRALELTLQAVALDPENGAYLDSLGWAYFRLGRYPEARRYLEQAASLVEQDATILEHLGDVYLALGDHQQARLAYQRVIELNDRENVEQVRAKLSELGSRE